MLIADLLYRSSYSQMFFKIDVLTNFANFTGKHLCWNHFLIKLQRYWKLTSTQMFSCKICNIFINTFFFYRTPPVAASAFKNTFTKPKPEQAASANVLNVERRHSKLGSVFYFKKCNALEPLQPRITTAKYILLAFFENISLSVLCYSNLSFASYLQETK